jgi:hypothetical protein
MTAEFRPKENIDFAKYLINLEEPLQELKPIYAIEGIPVFTRGNLSVISGKAKSRKSFLISLLASRMIDDDMSCRVLLFDTEQQRILVVKTAKRIHRLLEWEEEKNDGRLKVFAMREASTSERVDFIFASIEKLKPDFVFIDGARDLAQDFNNITECSDLVGKLMKYSSVYNCHICLVLHENKSADTLRGHLGTELVNKSESVLQVVANEGISTVSGRYTRNLPFDDFHFCVNDNGLPELCELIEKPKSNDKSKLLFNELLPATCCLSYSDLRTKVMEKTGKASRTAEYNIKDAIDAGIIVKNAAGMYYSFFNNNLNTENESLPF